MPRLFVNLDHVATLREARGTVYPDVLEAAHLAERSRQVAGITLHLREDRRHVQDEDMRQISREISLPFNFEMSVAEDVCALCLKLKPEQATLVPERRAELTTEGGLDLLRGAERIRQVTRDLQAVGTEVAFFIEPTVEAVRQSKELGATHVELHTGSYAHGATPEEHSHELSRLHESAAAALDLGLVVNAGHGLTVENVGPIAAVPGISDLNIGHAIVARSVFLGLEGALSEMAQAIRTAAQGDERAENAAT